MKVENVSDYILAMIEGIQGKSQSRLSAAYKKYDEKMPSGRIIEDRFDRVVSEIDRVFGDHLAQSQIHSQALFYSLFTVCYDHLYGLGSPVVRVKAGKISNSKIKGFLILDDRLRSGTVPAKYAAAFGRSTTDVGRRKLRQEYFKEMLSL